jgi:hypothetical protein
MKLCGDYETYLKEDRLLMGDNAQNNVEIPDEDPKVLKAKKTIAYMNSVLTNTHNSAETNIEQLKLPLHEQYF